MAYYVKKQWKSLNHKLKIIIKGEGKEQSTNKIYAT